MKPPKNLPILLLPCLVILSGCRTNDEIPMPQVQQNTYLSRAKPPQQFGFALTSADDDGITYAGAGRLHPRHRATATMLKGIPVLKLRGKAKRNTMNALIDFGSASSWLEFSKSQEFDAHFMGLDEMVIPYRGKRNTGGQNAYAGVVTQLRIDSLFIENVPFYIRMAINSLGPLAHGISSPQIDAVLGYDNLRIFEYIQIDLRNGTISFSSDIPYTPNEELLMTTARIINLPGYGLAVKGAIYGKPVPVILDFAGDYHFAQGNKKVKSTRQVSLGDVVFLNVPTLVLEPSQRPPHAGRRMLEPYIITVCSRKGVVYFERPPK